MGLFLPTAGASSQNHSLKDQNQGEEPFGAGGLYPSLTEEEMEAQGSQGTCPVSQGQLVAKLPRQTHWMAAAYSGLSWLPCSS